METGQQIRRWNKAISAAVVLFSDFIKIDNFILHQGKFEFQINTVFSICPQIIMQNKVLNVKLFFSVAAFS